MRPIERGSIPNDPITSNPIAFIKYDQALPHLIEKLGTYCSYCERRITNNLAVEHIQPKNTYPELELTWDNFLLVCTNCNSIKGDNALILSTYYWPHRDNTARAFEYIDGGMIRVNSSLNDDQKAKAQITLELTGLDRLPGHPKYSQKDRRWQERQQIWGIAKRALNNLRNNNTDAMREIVVDLAKSEGCWSIWMTVFREDTDMLRQFINAFTGTCEDCFDGDCNQIPRPGGAL